MKTVLATTSATLIFTPGATNVGTVNFRNLPITTGFKINRLMAIVNLSRNQAIYAESVPGLGYTNWNQSTQTLTLETNTASHSPSDVLQVIYDTPTFQVTPAEEYQDPVNKSRVSTPQSLIDTDFEYSPQSTKWETVQLTNNRGTVFYDPSRPITPSLIEEVNVDGGQNGNRQVTVRMRSNTLPTVQRGDIIYVQDLLDPQANGYFYVNAASLTTPGTFGYTAKPGVRSASVAPLVNGPYGTNIYDSNKSLFFICMPYNNAGIPVASNAISVNANTITVTTTGHHGLFAGDGIFILNTVPNTTNGFVADGAWTVNSVPTTNSFTVVLTATPNLANPSNNAGNHVVLPRPNGYFIHRAFDGGIQMNSGAGAPGSQVIRQTRKYFRYQSGKGLQFSTGTIFKPSLQLLALSGFNYSTPRVINGTSYTTSVTAITRVPHGMVPGEDILVDGVNDTNYNGTWEVANVINENTFVYLLSTAVTLSRPPSGNISPGRLVGANVRVGMFDSQNGLFIENDGTNTFAVRRNATFQVSGLARATFNSGVITGTVNAAQTFEQTQFTQQLQPGDFIVIKGMTYRVVAIETDTLMHITPEYRGPTGSIIISKVQDLRIPQSAWNIDRLDGTGSSGYVLDQTKMQMVYIDYSWYGAGFIRYGVRAENGNVYYFHKLANNNVNTEAYMRSGNLPARYEENTLPLRTFLTQTLPQRGGVGTGDSISVRDTTMFPASGIVKITNPTIGGDIEYIQYQGKTPTTFESLRRAQPGGNTSTATGRVFSVGTSSTTPLAPVPVELVSATGLLSSGYLPAQSISHWGSSVIMDGRFDDDSQFIFNAGTEGTPLSVGGGVECVIAALRLAPSVDSGQKGLLGQRDVVNRMQLKLRSMDIISESRFRINLYLNSRITNGSLQFFPVSGSSLAQFAQGAANVTLNPSTGESIFGFFTTPGGITPKSTLTNTDFGGNQANTFNQYTQTSQDLSFVRELGNSTLGGGVSDTQPNNVGRILIPQPSGLLDVYPDGPDILYITARNINPFQLAGQNGATTPTNAGILSRISWTEAQA